MTEYPNSQDEDELQLSQKFIELKKLVEENSTKIRETRKDLIEEKSSLEKLDKQIQDRDIKLGKKFDEVGQKFAELNENTSQYLQNAEKQSEDFLSQLATLEDKITQNSKNTDKLSEDFHDKFNNLKRTQEEHENRISKHKQTINEHENELQTYISKEKFNTSISDIEENVNKQSTLLQQFQSEIQGEIKNLEEKTQAQFDTLAKTVEMVGSGLGQLDQLNKKIIAQIEKYRLKLVEFRRKLKEIIGIVKMDQQEHFDNFSKIIESYNENIRTEISITTQSLKESDTKILDEVSTSFMTKKIGKELQQTISDLSEDLKMEAQKTRDELVQGLQKNVQEYEKSMKQQETSINDYKVELQNFQEEILAIIDRKVNEKYEVVFSLLSKVALEAEEITLLIKTSEIHIPPPILSETESSLDIDKDQVDSPSLPTLSDDSENFEEE
ncbi:MAG: hypothetical protein ACXAC8_06165 [Candidatus Hodarchaeales archaeon]